MYRHSSLFLYEFWMSGREQHALLRRSVLSIGHRSSGHTPSKALEAKPELTSNE